MSPHNISLSQVDCSFLYHIFFQQVTTESQRDNVWVQELLMKMRWRRNSWKINKRARWSYWCLLLGWLEQCQACFSIFRDVAGGAAVSLKPTFSIVSHLLLGHKDIHHLMWCHHSHRWNMSGLPSLLQDINTLSSFSFVFHLWPTKLVETSPHSSLVYFSLGFSHNL